jgi:protein gp37
VWVGVTVEDQDRADERREAFKNTPAAVKWVSYEPALGPVDWTGWEFVDQITSGGETGHGARPSYPNWHRAARDFCIEKGIKYFFKQHGAFLHASQMIDSVHYNSAIDGDPTHRDVFVKVRTKERLLDGRTWDQMLEV